MKFKKAFFIKLLIIAAVGVAGLIALLARRQAPAPDTRLKVVTSGYVAFAVAREIGEDKINLSMLLPANAEPHSFEPTPGTIIAVHSAGVFIYVSPQLEPWVKDILPSVRPGAAVVAAIKAKNNTSAPDETIKLPETTKQQAFAEHEQESSQPAAGPVPSSTAPQISAAPQEPAATAPTQPEIPFQAQRLAVEPVEKKPQQAAPDTPATAPLSVALPAEQPDETDEPEDLSKYQNKCLTVAFIDIDEAFSKHPRTVAVKEQIRLKILAKEQEVQSARQIIDTLTLENSRLAERLNQLKPFYERIVVAPQELAPKIKEEADSLTLENLLNRLLFSGAELITASPLSTPQELDDISARIAANQKIIAERGFFIDNYKYATREEILKLEEKEVKAILKDIYTEIKSFAKKRNIGAVVRKDEILYGEKPVNVTKDFVNRLKKSKKYRKK